MAQHCSYSRLLHLMWFLKPQIYILSNWCLTTYMYSTALKFVLVTYLLLDTSHEKYWRQWLMEARVERERGSLADTLEIRVIGISAPTCELAIVTPHPFLAGVFVNRSRWQRSLDHSLSLSLCFPTSKMSVVLTFAHAVPTLADSCTYRYNTYHTWYCTFYQGNLQTLLHTDVSAVNNIFYQPGKNVLLKYY